ncbi:hypothetical protein BJX61DRAFT_502908 [Aspergillus egyptiacus]|nr:hypothetical protein BJX61DRAFT_502908 [Aspergillus egyptiacus]
MSGDEAWDQLGKNLGPLGFGIYYLLKAFEPPNRGSGQKLTGWCLACNQDDDIVFLKTEGYYSGYLHDNPAPGPDRSTCKANWFRPEGISVKSRESDYTFMVLSLHWFDAHCTRDQLVEYAAWWNGYEVTGEEKDYYMALIRAAREEQAKRLRAQKEQEEKARQEKRERHKRMKDILRKQDPERYREAFPQSWLKENHPEEYRQMYPREYRRDQARKKAGLPSEDEYTDESTDE